MGALVGGILGLLFAPHEGSKTRELLSVRGEEALKDLQNSFEKNALKAKLVAEDAAGKVEKGVHQVRGQVENLSNNAEEKIEDLAANVKSSSRKQVSKVKAKVKKL